ncbi:MAG: ABC transporter permease [Treponema sp.]|jgi:spermidine/putrescine transport system permease protein|nr:ABC transporter permease [Treponema sp.]
MKKTAGKRRAFPLSLLPMYFFTLVFVFFPLIYMLFLSFMRREGAWGIAAVFSLRNYRRILEPVYMRTFLQSVRLALLCTFLVILAGYPAGLFMARLNRRWRLWVMLLLIIPFWTSSLLRLYGWMIFFRANGPLDMFLMGIGVLREPLRLLYSYPAVVAGMVYALLPFMIFPVYSSAEKLDRELIEAARTMGAPPFRAFLSVSLPLTMPGLFSGVILTFIPSMGLFFIADILGGNKVVLVGNLIQEQLLKDHDWPFAAALSVVLMLLTSLFLYLYRIMSRTLGSGGKELEGLV